MAFADSHILQQGEFAVLTPTYRLQPCPTLANFQVYETFLHLRGSEQSFCNTKLLSRLHYE
jgi:hypothetical protein